MPTPFKTPPATAEWDRTITHEEYTKLLKGYTPQMMEDKWTIKADSIDAQGNIVLHFYFGWSDHERIALDITPGDPDKTDAKEWATIVKISWADEELPFGSGRKISEYDAKRNAINLCYNRLSVDLPDEDPDDYEDLDEEGNVINDDA